MLSQGLGMIECLVLTISVGLMLDPLTHVAFAYAEADGSREQRLAAALGSVGISILAGGVSTAGSCALLLLTIRYAQPTRTVRMVQKVHKVSRKHLSSTW
jgi:hypothetical protein